MKSNSSTMKAVLSLLAAACVVMVVILTVKAVNEYKEANPVQPPITDYNQYVEDTPTSGGDIIIDDNNTNEMDSISSTDAP